jgi:ABC-type bacteriocin/lantibiotic exporter with double-glycine peptidase domain
MEISAGYFKKDLLYTRGLFFLLLNILFLFSCSSADIKVNEISHIVEGIPFYPQEAYQCGPSSLAAVLNYHGIDVSPEEISRDIYSKSARGTLNIDMVLYAEKKGLDVRHYSGSVEDIKQKIDSGSPLIVMVNNGFSLYQKNHFMVVIGYTDGGIISNSGRERFKFIPFHDFNKTWQKTNYWTLLAYSQKKTE